MERTALPEYLRHPRDQGQARFDTTEELVSEACASSFIPLERFPQIGLGAGATESVLALASTSADNPSFDVFPRVAARGIGGVALCVLGKNGVVPGRWLDRVGLARDLIP